MTESNKNIFYILLFFAMVCWGGSWVNVKFLGLYMDEFETMTFRYIITAISMVPLMIILRKSFKISLRNFILVTITSIALIAYMKYFYLGVKLGTASLGGSLVTSLIPINTFIMMALLKAKTVTKKDAFALTLGAIGVMTILHVWTFDSEKIFVTYNLYFILASLLWPIVTILSSKAMKISPITFTFHMYIVTSVLNLIFFVDLTTIEYSKLDSTFWINMLSISILASTFANTIYFLGIEKLGASEVSSFVFLVPFAAITLSAIFLEENISFSIIFGTILTIIAVKILNNIKILKKKKIESN